MTTPLASVTEASAVTAASAPGWVMIAKSTVAPATGAPFASSTVTEIGVCAPTIAVTAMESVQLPVGGGYPPLGVFVAAGVGQTPAHGVAVGVSVGVSVGVAVAVAVAVSVGVWGVDVDVGTGVFVKPGADGVEVGVFVAEDVAPGVFVAAGGVDVGETVDVAVGTAVFVGVDVVVATAVHSPTVPVPTRRLATTVLTTFVWMELVLASTV